jgi:sporulation protein YlmC with PRC-barrel domain
LASEIVGKSVADRQDEGIGKISELLIDLAGQKPSFALISNGRLLQKQQTFAVPLRSLSFSDKNRLVLDVNHKHIEEAGSFDDKTWAAASASNAGAIYQIELR